MLVSDSASLFALAEEVDISPNDDLEIYTEISPLRPALQLAWEWAAPSLNEDGSLSRNVFNPAHLKHLMNHISLMEGVQENGQLVDFKIRFLSRILVEHVGEKSGKMATASLPQAFLDRWLKAGQFALSHQKPYIARTHVIGKEHRRAEHLILPIRIKGEIGQILCFTDIWFPGSENS
ncbi:MAG: hypothetical protein JJ850_09135 [Kordiimonadaceae bacterium]|nr:hypothetical protein [Kordiimonadaceae bacterium]MBO6569293.1 hypothetical protein [Kordiimonadaceae bacterium]MBO6964769.1 hypothetical protein [Kordiimonadaceae bacterium]